jgi:hypothetical protein
MEAQPDSQGSDRSRRRRSRKPPQQMNFMFIDSSDHGVNAKPDKAVRSFVMHQARRSKTWSTRQKDGSSPRPVEADPPLASGTAIASIAEEEVDGASSPRWRKASATPDVFDAQPAASSASRRKRSRPSPPASTVSSLYDPRCSNRELYRRAQQALARQDGFALGVIDPFNCLAVQMDAKTSSMLDHCKRPTSWCACHI